ncbi:MULTISPECIES: phosphatidate cytidylyltransferase [Pacificibacter]|uniref:phosphatidate cytidylyltransferase n=1 Tax=Pacificibacter TaxID=1042323 RepID=UPI001C09EBBF|nr:MULTISPECIES: phosphatidate cytidylyltransferase [Pacificibacter]MBU2936861.1 phosphatidate cytidylyltransferase [Pacificibacter marinus]MDO6614855.1 phosphatidate cytidylyltransferase [Pacificibacter sp. 1_MG-2023]
MSAQSPKPARNWRDLGPRVASAAVMIGVGILVIISGHIAFELLLAVLALIGVWEFYKMARFKADVTGLIAEDFYALGAYFILFVLGLAGLWAVSFLTGPAGLIFVVSLVVATDSMGYFVGRTLGGKKFWPSVSPKKTWSGVLGGWVGAALIALIAVLFLRLDLREGLIIIGFAIILSFASQLGDIAQSAIKRRMGVKDSSNIIPGHGGVLDRFDALLAVGAVLFFLRLVTWTMWGAS